ncbi:GntR family transcriptional regulator [Hydrogenophaga sp. BPS33]|uniref:GntR family transcriptional regulator n=1 Tax=Hydrogenophaga sp. BPS33 TaxID=2651974 RepID=UPI00135A894A|nr:GntR family transcriptional regulator [Hydrogenophaga sp. BPS33]
MIAEKLREPDPKMNRFHLADVRALIAPGEPMVMAVEQTLAHGHGWSRSAAPVAERIAISIAGAIVCDHLSPGQRLPEKELSAALGVSRAPTREAMRILERERLVDFQARRGCVVAELDEKEVMELFAVRSTLHEILFAQLMAEQRPALASLIAQRLARLDALQHGPTDHYAVGSYLLNLSIVHLCGNRLVADLLTSIALRTLRHLRRGHATFPASVARSLHSWRAIHRAVMLGDTARVLTLIQERTDDARTASLNAVRAKDQKNH